MISSQIKEEVFQTGKRVAMKIRYGENLFVTLLMLFNYNVNYEFSTYSIV